MPDDGNDDCKVGYAKPPKKSRFKQGQSGNPRGRPRGSRNVRSIILRLSNRAITVREGGRQLRLPAKEAVIWRIINDALRGKAAAQKQFLELLARYAPEELEATVDGMRLSSENQEILKHYLERHTARRGSGNDPDKDA